MKKFLPVVFGAFFFCSVRAQTTLVFYPIQTDSSGNIISWYNSNAGSSYNHCLQLIWNFWKSVPACCGGNKFYMMDHSWNNPLAGNMVGGDQFAMALSSWQLYYAYTGDTALLNNMVYIANTYLANSLSPANYTWPNIPYPCNYTLPSNAIYDGDFILGANFTQPDKAGSFGKELVTLFKITGDSFYLQTAVNIANTLSAKVVPGSATQSPFPFKVNAQTGVVSSLIAGDMYTADVVPTLRLFEDLSKLGIGNTVQYDTAYNTIKRWVQNYPEQNNNWGCFFEDILGPSNTETNAVTMAWYILQHPNWSSTWQQEARGILDWTYNTFQDTAWNSYGVTAIFEQSVDLKPGGSHTSRYASTELLYSAVTGDTTRVAQAVRQLNWATYMVDSIGECRFSPSESSVWYTDGYGDYVRHFMRGMAAYPAIAPDSANHLLGSSSVVTHITYQPQAINYITFDDSATEVLRLTSKPLQVKANGNVLTELSNLNADGWVWTPYALGGVLNIKHSNQKAIDVLWDTASAIAEIDGKVDFEIYPNPTANSFRVNYIGTGSKPYTLQIDNALGARVKEIFLGTGTGPRNELIDINELQGGTYFISINFGNGRTAGKKLVVAK